MKLIAKLSLPTFLLLTVTLSSHASVLVNSPSNGSAVNSPFSLSASTSLCGGQQVSAMGYSLDSSPDTTIVNAAVVTASVSAPAGGHTLHVKAWGQSGAACDTDVAITVNAASNVPSNASSVSSLQAFSGWSGVHDTGTPGTSSGSSSITSSPSLSGAARQFSMNYSDYGGERFSATFGDEEAASNFLLDTWVYIPSPNTGLANLELDLNQVLSGGQTVLYGMQCDGWSNTWDYSVNLGTTTAPVVAWAHTSAPCNVRNWSTNVWHHVQLSYSRNETGWITFQSVALDGVSYGINKTVLGAYSLGWGPTLLVNVQLDGLTAGSGSAKVIVDNLTLYYW
jgi:hypothetical protein